MPTPSERSRNWAGNQTYHAERLAAPSDLESLQRLVRQSTTVKTLGTRHCFNEIADTQGLHISLENFQDIEIAEDGSAVTIGAGVAYGRLAAYLHERGYGLRNLASLPHISVAGACATATHGSGVRNGSLSTELTALQLVTSEGEARTFTRQHDLDTFPGVAVHLGALGIVTRLTLSLEPTYTVQQRVYQNLPLDLSAEELEAVLSSAYSVSLFTHWQSERFDLVWMKHRSEEDVERTERLLHGATPATENLHPLRDHPVESCTLQLGRAGPWHERLPHFRLEHTPSSGAELQTEYFVARKYALPALKRLFELREQIAPLAHVTEVRTIAADDHWLSPFHERDSVGLHFTWKPFWPKVRAVLPKIEARLADFAPRPHWGKLFTLSPEGVRSQYRRFEDFMKLARHLDPQQKMLNPFLEPYLR